LGFESSELYLFKVVPDSPADKAGLKAGDRIVRIDQLEPMVWEEVLGSVKSYKGDKPLEIAVLRGSESHVFRITPEMTSHMSVQGTEERRFTIGINPWISIATPESIILPITNPIAGIVRGAVRTWDVSVMTVVSFLRLFQNKISPRNIGGVISIGQAAHETLKMGLAQYLTMMGAISVNLFILNLLPIPVLDGGHLLFYSIEALKGTPLNMRKMEIAQQVGLFVLMSLMVFALFNDVSRIFGIW
jgi:regulator of sigma E protease